VRGYPDRAGRSASRSRGARAAAPSPPAAAVLRLRHRPPEWAVEDDDGRVVGWIEEHHIPTAGAPFYALAGVHPGTGERIELQLSADLDERLAKLEEFLHEPDAFAQHFTTGTRARGGWDARRAVRPWELGTGKGGRHG
jgi:hypothetical protein